MVAGSDCWEETETGSAWETGKKRFCLRLETKDRNQLCRGWSGEQPERQVHADALGLSHRAMHAHWMA